MDLLSILVAALFAQEPAGGPPPPKVEYYDVTGATAKELRQSLDSNRPGGKSSRFGDGRVKWFVHWDYHYNCDTGCRITDATTSVDVSMFLPRWGARGSAAPELAAQWDRYMRALRLHEDGHEALARDAGAAIGKRLLSLGDFKNADDLAAGVDRAANALLAEYQSREVGYDLKTVHGVVQGATFP